MHRVVKKPLAEEDLISIWEYSYHEWGESKADKYLLGLDTAIQDLVRNPQIGKSRENIRLGYRSIQINRHIIYYQIKTNTIDIIRVLHERMQPTKYL